ncbi:MAG: DNA repair exonuclease [Lentisphaeria bacterium]|nr:DNA repair exonuclease [Lentisphaeria bacterium]
MGTPFRFLHCADLHIGSAFAGLSRRIPELDGWLSTMPYLAWRNVVETAKKEKVDFVVIAGDCFDRNAPSLQGRLEFKKGLDELDRAGIPVFVVSGNHDPWPQAWSEAVRLPENVRFFLTDKAVVHEFVKDGEVVASIAGVSHCSLNVLENLAAMTGEALKNAPGVRIAVVHANLGGDMHAAPATEAELASFPVDYWALGHLHNRRVRREDPFIVYSGSVQGKDIYEPGTQGCFIVDCNGFGKLSLTFHPASVLTFEIISLDIKEATSIDQVLKQLLQEIEKVKTDVKLLFRLKISGFTDLDAELRGWNADELHDYFYDGVKNVYPDCFLEELILLTRTPEGEGTVLLPADELDKAEQELAEEKFLETLYDEMRSVRRELPPVRAPRFEELRKEGTALLAELLTGKLEL